MSLTFKRIKPSGISYYIRNAGLALASAAEYYSQAMEAPVPATQADTQNSQREPDSNSKHRR